MQENIKRKEESVSPEIVSAEPVQSMETQIDSNLGQVGQKSEKFNENITSLGGPEGVERVWNKLDEAKKQQILTKIKELSEKRTDAIDYQEGGAFMMNPKNAFRSLDFSESMRSHLSIEDNNSAMGYIASFLLYFTGITPTMGAAVLTKGTFDRIKNAFKLKRENSKLKKLENK